ncbi:hypothetical protein DTB58_11445 [Streptomyces griseus]|nr:hypothetical protein [Streptomyces griseus]
MRVWCWWAAWHAPSSVATLCDDGILPFGLAHSGVRSCQNRITGDPRTSTAGAREPDHLWGFIPPAGESSACLDRWTAFMPVCRLVQIFDYESRHRVDMDSSVTSFVR